MTAYFQSRGQASTQSKGELRAQAERISAAVLGEDPARYRREPLTAGTRIGVYNNSDATINHVVVTLVIGDRGARDYDPELRHEAQRYLLFLPPGKAEVEVSASWHGGSAQPNAAFVDQSGRSWVRESDGALKKIGSPVSYYGLPDPMAWGEAVPRG